MNPPHPLRGSRPDAESVDALYLIKNVTHLRATYQVRLLALKANELHKRLVLVVPPSCRFDAALEQLAAALPRVVAREDLS